MRDRVEFTAREFADKKSFFRAALELYEKNPEASRAFAAVAGTVGLCRISAVMLTWRVCSLLEKQKQDQHTKDI